MFLYQFNRAAFMGVEGIWDAIHYGLRGEVRWAAAAGDLLYTVLALPLVCVDFRLGVSSVISCSDASLKGAGAVISRELTTEGSEALLRRLAPLADLGTRHWVLCENFAGIAGARRACQLLGLTPRA